MRGQGGSPFKQSEDITRTDSWLDENCSAGTPRHDSTKLNLISPFHACMMLHDAGTHSACSALSADTYIPSTAALMSEGSGENFQMVASLSRGKKRRRTSEPTHRDDIDDAALDRAASRLEMELSKLESDNKQLISCFVTLGEQVQSMMNENNQMRSVISFANEGTSENCAPTLKALKASFNKSVQDPLAMAEISPTVRFLAELALMSGAAANLEP